jgi:hypothetical protein
VLLGNPVELLKAPGSEPRRPPPTRDSVNAANTDFTPPKNRADARGARPRSGANSAASMAACDRRPEDFRPRDDRLRQSREDLPGRRLLGRATVADADAAVAAARRVSRVAATPASERADILERAAGLMEARRFELNGALEVSRPANPGSRPMRTYPRPSTSAAFTRTRCALSARPRVTQASPGRGHPGVDPARRGRRHRPVELPARDPLRPDRRARSSRATRSS